MTITRIEFGIKCPNRSRITPVQASTAERFIKQGVTKGSAGILMRRLTRTDTNGVTVGEWKEIA